MRRPGDIDESAAEARYEPAGSLFDRGVIARLLVAAAFAALLWVATVWATGWL